MDTRLHEKALYFTRHSNSQAIYFFLQRLNFPLIHFTKSRGLPMRRRGMHMTKMNTLMIWYAARHHLDACDIPFWLTTSWCIIVTSKLWSLFEHGCDVKTLIYLILNTAGKQCFIIRTLWRYIIMTFRLRQLTSQISGFQSAISSYELACVSIRANTKPKARHYEDRGLWIRLYRYASQLVRSLLPD